MTYTIYGADTERNASFHPHRRPGDGGRLARGDLLPPWLASHTAALVYGPPDIGKSFLALGVACAVATGGSFLGWRAPRQRRVVYLDGKMAAVDLRSTLTHSIEGMYSPDDGVDRRIH